MYEERFYRDYMNITGYTKFTVIEKESDLQFIAKINLEKEARELILKYRGQVEAYIKEHSEFLTSLTPIQVNEAAPAIVKHMARAAFIASVGPMATIAGAISEYVGRELLNYTDEIIVENGGDIFMHSNVDRKVLVYAGNSPFSNKVAVTIPVKLCPLGVCTSAGTVGHSLSFGRADAVMVLCKDTLIADASATAIGNIVKSPGHIDEAIEFAKSIKELLGVLIIIDDKLGAWGNITLCEP